MVYMAADNDLEPFAIGDINEMEYVGSTTGMNILVQLDRSPNYNTSNGDWTNSRRLFITQDTSLTQIASESVDEMGETNTGDPATLVNFASWAVQTYPAEHYALIIWDHGGSWYGVASDESSDYDDLSLPELTQALQQTVDQTGIGQFDIIGFDACLMGALEVYQAVAPYAHYGIGSAELIPGNGWDYFGSLDALASTPTIDGETFGRAVVDSFTDFYTTVVTSYPTFSLGLVDLSQSDKVVAALDDFTTQVSIQPDTAVDVIGSARSETHVFGAFDDPQFTDVWAATDLLQFMDLVAKQSADPALQNAANNAHLAGEDMMLYYQSSEALQGSGGLSIYFPRSSNNFYENNREERYLQEVPSSLKLWPNFLGQFYTLAAQFTSAGFENTLLGVSADGPQAVVSVQAVKNSLVDSSVLILLDIGRGQRIIVDYQRLEANSSDTTMNGIKSDTRARRQDKAPQTVLWAATIPYLSDGNTQLPILLLRSRYNANSAIINGVVYLQDGPPVSAQLVVDLTTNEVTSIWGIRNIDGTPMPSEITVQPGDLFQATWFVLGPRNDIIAVPANFKLVFTDEPLFIVWLSAPPGAYTFTTLAAGVGGGEATQNSIAVAITDTSGDQIVLVELDPADPDYDDDGVLNEADNCPVLVNPQQEDADGDGIGDVCDLFNDLDIDQDGVLDVNDNCPSVANPDQQDTDGNGVGDACQAASDIDQDGILDNLDNCPTVYNQYQSDYDGDGLGDACDPESGLVVDRDEDGIADDQDNCPDAPNADQIDVDQDGIGDVCDPLDNSDQDGIANSQDNCPWNFNPDQSNADNDGFGDACDTYNDPPPISPIPDSDQDGILDSSDNCPSVSNPGQEDTAEISFYYSADGVGDACDNCPYYPNASQANQDGDGFGDECDLCLTQPGPDSGCPTATPMFDIDGDGVDDDFDNCMMDFNPGQEDMDGDGIGDVCDDSDGDGFVDAYDMCPTLPGPSSGCPMLPPDTDGDSVYDFMDNCPLNFNPGQEDTDFDNIGDVCDSDLDADGFDNALDNCPYVSNSGQEDIGESSVGNTPDGVGDACDNCPSITNSDQLDSNADGIGDACAI